MFAWNPHSPIGLVTATQAQSIQWNLRSILLTRPNERRLMPEFGSKLMGATYRAYSEKFASELAEEVRLALLRSESRIDVDRIHVSQDPHNGSEIAVEIYYRPKTSSQSAQCLRIPLQEIG